MSAGEFRRILLGPQSPDSNLAEAIERARLPAGPLAVISAGWQEGEGELDDLAAIVGRPVVDLALYRRAEAIFAAHRDLHRAYRGRQDTLVKLQQLYRQRLKYLTLAARRALASDADPSLAGPEQRHAIAQLRALDRHHRHRSESVHAEYQAEIEDQASLAPHREEIEGLVGDAAAVLITGGHALVLLNRMRLFGVHRMLEQVPVIAWSAGAMVCADQVVLYHDRMPEGRREAEVMAAGFRLIPGYVLLPDARHRLRVSGARRAGLFSRRFSPDPCLTLDCGTLLEFAGDRLTAAEGARRLTRRGPSVRMDAP